MVRLKGKAMQVTAVLTPAEEGGYIAYNPETRTTTQGETVEEALAMLKEAVELYLEDEDLVLPGAPLVTMLTVGEHA
jgi:predicted RNase H-like HicB family nuclease